MGAGGVTNRGVVQIYGRSGSLPITDAKPNSRYDLIHNGVRIQSRWFDAWGNVVRNRDYLHQDIKKNHFFPHDHIWTWVNGRAIRNKEFVEPDYINYN